VSYKPKSLFRMLEAIDRHELLLPHIQRPFVWDEEQMVRLFDSLMRNYPVQTLLFWRTKEAIKARRFMESLDREADLSDLYDSAKSVADVEKTFVLDGQQRLQTLYALFRGTVLDPHENVLEAYLDVTQGRTELDGTDLLYRLTFSPEPMTLPNYRLRNLMERDAQKDAASIAYDVNDTLATLLKEEPDERRARERQVHTNISQLRTLLREEQHFWVEELDGVANKYEYRKVLDIFVRVNSGGTKLTASDLMFAALKEGWEDIEENTEQTVEMLNLGGRLQFESSFPLKCLVVAHGEGAEVNDVAKFTGVRGEALLHKLKENWDWAEASFQELRDFIENDLRLFSDRVIRSYNAFVPLFDHLYHNPKPKEGSRARMRAYYHKAQLFNWFGASGDTTINAMHQILGKPCPDGFPLQAVVDYFGRRSYPIQVGDGHLTDNRLRSILLSIVYVDRWGTSPFNVRFKGNEPHVDHIYPQSMLRRRLGQVSAQINDIGNLRYVGATDNIRKRAELPADYFVRLKRDHVDVAKHLLVDEFTEYPERMVFDEPTFLKFRELRREEIRRTLKRVVDLDALDGGVPAETTPSVSSE
jgi:hypothetical protein